VSADASILDSTLSDLAGRGSDGSALDDSTTFRQTRYRLGILPLGRCPVNALQSDFAALRQNVYRHFPREVSNLHFHRVFIPSDYPDRLN
jgi:hypothetical protein